MSMQGGGWGPPGGGGPSGPGGWGPGGQPPAPPGGGGGGWGPPGQTPPPGGYGPPPGPQGQSPGGYGMPSGPTGYGPPPAAPAKKGSGAGLIIGIAAGGLILIGGIVTVVAVLLFGRSSSGPNEQVSDGKGGTITLPAKVRGQAHKHLPAGCEAVVRVDVAKALEVPALTKHVVPALDELEADAQNDPKGKELQEFLKKAGVEPKKDIKEAMMCGVDLEKRGTEPRFVMIFGGDLRPETIVPAFEAVEVPKPESSTFDGRKVATGRGDKGEPIVVGQAADGTVVFANDRVLFEQAVKESDNHRTEYNLPTTSEASMVLGRAFIDAATAGAGANNPFARDLGAITRALGIVQLSNPRAELRITMASPRDATRFNQTVTGQLLPALKRNASRGKSQFGEIEALGAAKSRVDGNDVVIEAPWTAQGVESAAQQLAKEIREAKSRGF